MVDFIDNKKGEAYVGTGASKVSVGAGQSADLLRLCDELGDLLVIAGRVQVTVDAVRRGYRRMPIHRLTS